MEEAKQINALKHELGTFFGFNRRDVKPIERSLTAEEVLRWNHEADGEAEFWPSGDHQGVAWVFSERTTITAAELMELDRILSELGEDGDFNFLRIHYAFEVLDRDLHELTGIEVEGQNLEIFIGSNIWQVREDAAYELFENFFPEHFKFWETGSQGILTFDWDQFLERPFWTVHELHLCDRKAMIIAPTIVEPVE